ncbi:MAG TPA: hypothetical protein VN706_23765 [Gemmatimonadaceae bacterium]|nr:hypothetical protein [Gemmatimonadaceae bacterium]
MQIPTYTQLGLTLLALAAGCGSAQQVVCPDIAIRAVGVRVIDNATGAPITSSTQIAWSRSGDDVALTEHVPASYPDTSAFILEIVSAGSYQLIVSRAGYLNRNVSVNVASTGGPCPESVPVTLVVPLDRATP